MQDKHTGNAFLTTFIGEYDALVEQQDDKGVTSYNSRSLLSNQQLLKETDALLSSLVAPPSQNKCVNVVTQARTTSGRRMDDEQKRKHRNALAAVRRNRYRHKLKGEKEALELQESELSKLLANLKAARVKEEVNPGQQMMLNMWRTVAMREHEKRLEVETQNKRLKEAVFSRSNMIHNVQRLMLQRRGKDANMDAAAWCEKEEDGAAVFRAFKAELDFMYAKTDEVVRGVEFKMAWPMAYSPKKRLQDGVEVYDTADATVLPYSYEQVCRAVSYMMLSDLEGNETHQDHPLGNTATIKYPLKCRLKGGENSRIVTYSATRRYAEESRMVFVWRALYEGHDCLSGFHVDETGWFVVRPSLTVSSADASDSDEASSTILETYTHFVPMGMKNTSSSGVDKDRFAAIFIKTGEEEVKGVVGMLEKVLFGEKPVVSPSIIVNE